MCSGSYIEANNKLRYEQDKYGLFNSNGNSSNNNTNYNNESNKYNNRLKGT